MAHILLAESDALLRIKLEWTLKDLDFNVTVASSPEEVAQALDSTAFELAIMSHDFLGARDVSADTRFIQNGSEHIPVLTIDRFFSSSPGTVSTSRAASPQPLTPPDMLTAIMSALDAN